MWVKKNVVDENKIVKSMVKGWERYWNVGESVQGLWAYLSQGVE